MTTKYKEGPNGPVLDYGSFSGALCGPCRCITEPVEQNVLAQLVARSGNRILGLYDGVRAFNALWRDARIFVDSRGVGSITTKHRGCRLLGPLRRRNQIHEPAMARSGIGHRGHHMLRVG